MSSTKSLIKKIATTSAVVLTAGTFIATEAAATEGYFANGIGARSKGMAGAGVADSKDATAITLNPAGLVHAGEQLNISASAFMPFRSYTAANVPGFVVPGTEKSKNKFFIIPNFAYSKPISENTTFGISLSGNGGMNTEYKKFPGVFNSGNAGIDLIQMNLTAGLGHKFNQYFSIGVAPILTMQRFKAKGLGTFIGLSSDPANLTNRGYSYSFGAGARIGAEFAPAENLRVGVSFQTRTYMSRFKKYAGLFAERGDFDVPANFQIGVAYDVTPDLTFNFDIKHIMFSNVKSIGNQFSFLPANLGTTAGTGFAWKDVTTFKFGAEYNATEALTVRAGYSYNTQPIRKNSAQLALNILAPATSQHHITGGASYKFNENSQFDFAVMFSPSTKVSGFGPAGLQPISVKMHQLEVTAGYTYNFN